ncbi:MAG TPA: MBL fold metallo-hydrolase [Pseudonocardiaceae bacterium]|jgi:ribonuclease BN (tRNA processing enzyme)|nr:MBL fold metallo-hydrolase [Pseudonocardiaceae bacterium]
MQLTILGCRSGSPADGQPSSGYLVETAGARLLLDCGPGIAVALSERVTPWTLDGVVISHLHSDHCYDLLPIGKSILSSTLEVPGGPRRRAERPRSVPLLAPAGSSELFARWAKLFPVTTIPMLDRAFETGFDVREYYDGASYRIGDCAISLRELKHVRTNCGIRVESPTGTLVYSGDTGMTPALVELAAGADVLLCEATFSEPDRSEHGHLAAAEAGQVAAEAGVGELVLTHFASTEPQWLASLPRAAATEFDGPIRLAAPGLRIPVTSALGAAHP